MVWVKKSKTLCLAKQKPKRLNGVLKDFALVAPDPVRGGFRFGSVAPSSITNPNMRNIVQNLQADVAKAQEQSSSALFNAVKTGRIDDADSLVQAAVKDPKLVDELINKVPQYNLDEPFWFTGRHDVSDCSRSVSEGNYRRSGGVWCLERRHGGIYC